MGGRQTKGKEVGATRAKEQEKNKMRGPQREPEAGKEPTWDQTGGGQTGPATWTCWASSEAGGSEG